MKIAKLVRDWRRREIDVVEEPDGIMFPTKGVKLVGEYVYESNRYGREVFNNTLTIEGVDHMFDVAFRGVAQITGWYLTIWGNNYTPDATLTAADFPTVAGEFTSATEGYTEATRPAWNPDAAAGGAIVNLTNKAQFTIATASQIVIRGAAVLSESTKGATTGILASVGRLNNDRTHFNGDDVSLAWRLRLVP